MRSLLALQRRYLPSEMLKSTYYLANMETVR